MMRLTVEQLAQAAGGVLLADDGAGRRIVEGITWDTRELVEGNVFLAMPGERVDGNDFVVKAIGLGAAAIIMTRDPSDAERAIAGEFSCPLVIVGDGRLALSNLAGYWRNRLHAVVVGVTGSTGKTSTKDFLHSVLSQKYKTAATRGNHNNELGVPYTILSADEDTEVLVVEMGMRGVGQIAYLCEIAQPSIGVVTNVGVAHMELLGSRENIARAKAELLASLPPTGLAVVNADDDLTPRLLEAGEVGQLGCQVRSFGTAADADVRAVDVSFDEDVCATFGLCVAGERQADVHVGVPGKHNVSNALAAAAVGSYLGLAFEQVADGLSHAGASGMRMEVLHAPGDVRVVNDAYNANPDSMRSSLDTLACMHVAGRRIAVLGDMGELGDNEQELHREVGAHVARTGADMLVCVGDLAEHIAEGARSAGMDAKAVVECTDVDDVVDYLKLAVQPGDVVLVKASRFMGMERVAEELVE